MKYILYFNEIDREKLRLVGEKSINLAELSNSNFVVPGGFCITTEAYDILMENEILREMRENLNTLDYKEIDEISEAGKKIREIITGTEVSEAVKIALYGAWNNLGANYSYAVRSSVCTEDLKEFSFIGQQETYLNITGYENIIKAVQNCWASLFTERAIIYRNKNGFDNTKVKLAVVVQRMIGSEYSGIMFTADPISGSRRIINIDAGYGLGEAVVSGLIIPDFYQIKDSEIIKKEISKKEKGIFPDNEGGVIEVEIVDEYMEKQVLSDEQIIKLANTGEKIQDVFKVPQIIEWGFYQGKFYMLQSKPILSLFPIPCVNDNEKHVFLLFRHMENTTNPMKPSALSIFESAGIFDKFGAKNSLSLQYEAGGRIYIDLSYLLNIPELRKFLPGIIKKVDEQSVEIIKKLSNSSEEFAMNDVFAKKTKKLLTGLLLKIKLNLHLYNGKRMRIKGEKFFKNEIVKWEKDINSYKGIEKIKRIKWYVSGILNFLFSNAVIFPLTAVVSFEKIRNICAGCFQEEEFEELLEQLSMSLDNDVTNDMMSEIYDMSDMIRGNKELDNFLKNTTNETFWENLENLKTNLEFTLAMKKFISKYGVRCPGELDVSVKRWKESPAEILPLILNRIETSEINEHNEKFKNGKKLAKSAEEKILETVKKKLGNFKFKKVKKYIKLYRNLMGFRESPKYFIVRFLDIVREALLDEAEVLKIAGIFGETDDIFYFSLDEIMKILIGTYDMDIDEVLNKRKEKFENYQKMTPPRVITSDGEILKSELENVTAFKTGQAGITVTSDIKEEVVNAVFDLNDPEI